MRVAYINYSRGKTRLNKRICLVIKPTVNLRVCVCRGEGGCEHINSTKVKTLLRRRALFILESVCLKCDYLKGFCNLCRSPWLGCNEIESNEGINMHAHQRTNTHSGGGGEAQIDKRRKKKKKKAHSFFLCGISYSSLHPNKPVGAAIMGRKPCIYSRARINGRTTSCVAREAVIFNMLWCQHVAGTFPWFLLRDRAGTFLSVRHRDRWGSKREREGETERDKTDR